LDNLEAEPNEAQPQQELQEETAAEETIADEGESLSDALESEYFLLDDKEVSVDDVRSWRDGHMMQQDYTRKTQGLSEERKAFESQKASMETKAQEIEALVSELESEIFNDSMTAEIDELWEYSPAEARKKERELNQKREKLEKARALAKDAKGSVSQERVLAEQQKLIAAKPEWLDGGKPTKQYQEDTAAINDYFSSAGFTAEDVAAITDHRIMLMALDAAKLKQGKGKAQELKQKAAKAPRVTKPSRGAPTLQTQLVEAQKQLKATGSERDYIAVQKLKRQINASR